MSNRMYIESDEELAKFIEDIYYDFKKKYPNSTKKQVRFFIYLLLKNNDIKNKMKAAFEEETNPFGNETFRLR